MKKMIVVFVMGLLMVSCASYTIDGQKVTKEEYALWTAQKVREGIENRQFVISMKSMHPFRGASRHLTGDYSLELYGDSVVSYLPYFGEVRMVPYGGGKGLNFIGRITAYEAYQVKAGLYRVIMGVYNDEEEYRYILEVFENGSSTLDVTSYNRDPISFMGNMTFDKKR
jgi:hypothetical protein